MNKTGIVIFIFVLFLNWTAFSQESKPVALIGVKWAVKAVKKGVLEKADIKCEILKNWLPPSEYHKYSVIYLAESFNDVSGIATEGWTSPDDMNAVSKYLEDGGIIILSGAVVYTLGGGRRDLKAIEKLIGFKVCWNLKTKTEGVKFINSELPGMLGISDRVYNWNGSNFFAKELGTAETLANFVDEKTGALAPYLLQNSLGKGKVFWLASSYFRTLQALGKLGEADADGNFILNRNGEDAEALTKLITYLVKSGNPQTEAVKREEWVCKPLGTQGELKYPEIRISSRTPEAAAVSNKTIAALPLVKNSVPCAVIVVPAKKSPELNAIANTVKRHIDEMGGTDIKILKYSPDWEFSEKGLNIFSGDFKGFNAIVVADNEILTKLKLAGKQLSPEAVFLKSIGNTIVVSGEGNGIKIAAYTFLEKLGCRYLWPGKLGKVIPRKNNIEAPFMDICMAPPLAVRGIRPGNVKGERPVSGLKRVGIDVERYTGLFLKELSDAPGADSWFTWQGMGKRKNFQWGHSFGDYWKRFGKSHPEWFALQPDGLRSQETSSDRSQLCMASMELAAQVAEDRLKTFAENPDAASVSICLNDGGATSFCMCRACRELDPVNAPPLELSFRSTIARFKMPYVSLSDRVLEFSNRVAERVSEKIKGKYLSVYAYSCYKTPPVKVKPHPALMFLYVGIGYTDDKVRSEQTMDFMKWSSFGNPVFWRPNSLGAWGHYSMPQNFARKIFEDFHLLSCNGLAGTDFDCMDNNWALKGFIYYILAKAHWNPESKTYDELLDDYCVSGFGPAHKEIKEYLNQLEAISNKAAQGAESICDVFDENRITALKALLDEAEKKAVGNNEFSERIKFLRTGLVCGEYNRKLYIAKNEKNVSEYKKQVQKFREFLKETSERYPMALNGGSIGYSNVFLHSPNP